MLSCKISNNRTCIAQCGRFFSKECLVNQSIQNLTLQLSCCKHIFGTLH
uniref:Putative mitochondrial intermediate peptidase isoform X2 n=1 Tax=Rhizophora mucronata TaxID=61149 RepID=A0A2P2M030_RHIMU